MLDFENALVGAVLAFEKELPPMQAMAYEYVVAGNGLLIRAEDSRLQALIHVAPAGLRGLAEVEPYARLLVPKVPVTWLNAIYRSAVRHLPNEVLYQLFPDDAARNSLGGWAAVRPAQAGSQTALTFADTCQAVVDLHSHNTMEAFFSGTDDGDEQGLRFYVVIGMLGPDQQPEIAARVGVYGHHMRVPALTVFEALGPFVDTFDREELREALDGNA